MAFPISTIGSPRAPSNTIDLTRCGLEAFSILLYTDSAGTDTAAPVSASNNVLTS